MNELEALRAVYNSGLRMRRTAVVDDDFPEAMHYFDSSLKSAERHIGTTQPSIPEGLTFDHLHEVNSARAEKWNGDTPWSVADRVVEFIGEFGEAANVMKKLKRLECGMPGTEAADYDKLRSQLCDELGDAQICLDLVANACGVNLGVATILKFNKTSDKVGFDHKL